MNANTQRGMLLVYSDQCGHCRNFMPTYNKLRDEYKDRNKANVVMMSVTELQKLPDLRNYLKVDAVPALFLMDGATDRMMRYEGSRELEPLRKTLWQWIH